MVFRLGFATSRAEARQLVRHGHFTVNGRKATIPSLSREAGRCASTLRESSREIARIAEALEASSAAACRSGSSSRRRHSRAIVKALPTRDDITMPIEEQLIVELYSK